MQNYTAFIGYHELDWFDHIRDVAWKEKGGGTDIKSTEAYNVMGAPTKQDATGSYSQQQSSKLRKTGGDHHLVDMTNLFYQHAAMIKVVQGPLVLLFLLCSYLIRKKAKIVHSLRTTQ